MVIKFYKNSADIIQVDKTNSLEFFMELNGHFRDEIQLTHPVITIELDGIPLLANYVYIQDFNRYYYISSINYIGKNLIEITLDIDILMSYKNGIKKLTAFVDRNENDFNSLIPDTRRTIKDGYISVYSEEIVNNILTETKGMYSISGLKIDADL